MATLTWIGGGDNSASDPSHWSPPQLPSPGDSLVMPTANTMNIQGNVLAGDTLLIGTTATSDPRPPAVLNVSGRAHFSFQNNFPPQGVASTTVNLAENSQWIGGFNSVFAPVFVNGPGDFKNTFSFVGGTTSVVNADITGRGTIHVTSAQSIPGSLEVTKSVSANERIEVVADPGRHLSSTLIVDDPKDFRGAVVLGRGETLLNGITADSYDIRHDVLTLFQANKVVEKLSLSLTSDATGFGVSQTAGGINIHADGSQPGVALPRHSFLSG